MCMRYCMYRVELTLFNGAIARFSAHAQEDNVLCQQLARRQDHAGLYVVHTYIAQ